MKIKIEIDCEPAEARAFLGLPDVEPLNAHLVAEMQRRMSENLNLLNPDDLMRQWTSFGMQAQEQMRKLMESAASASLDPKARP